MKLSVLAVTAALFTVAASIALAQEESTPPAPSPEATAAEKPSDPTVSVTTEKTASPAPATKAEPSSSPSKSSSPAAKSSPSATPSSSSSPAADMPTKKSTPEATIRDIEDKWEASVSRHDPS